MLFTHLTQAMTALVDVLAQNQRRLVEAQFDVCRQWVEACRPAQLNASATPLANAAEDTRLDGPMQATQSLLIAQVQAGNDLMMLSERLVSSMNRDLVKQLDKARSPAPAATRWNPPSPSVAVLMNPCPRPPVRLISLPVPICLLPRCARSSMHANT